MQQLTIFEATTVQQDPLYQLIDNLMISEIKEIVENGKIIRVELKNVISNIPIYEYEAEQGHGIAKGIDEIYDILKGIIDSEFNRQLI